MQNLEVDKAAKNRKKEEIKKDLEDSVLKGEKHQNKELLKTAKVKKRGSSD